MVNDQITDSVTVAEPVNDTVNQALTAVEETLTKDEAGYVMGKDELKRIFERVEQLRTDGKLYTPTQEDIENEPTALAFTPYNVKEESNDKYNGTESSDVIETTETISDDLRAILEKELTPDDLRTYAEKSIIVKKTNEDPNPHLTPGVRT